MANPIPKTIAFFREAQIEIRKVTWPSRSDVVRNTVIVLVISLAVAAFLGFWDFILAFILGKIIS